MEDIQTATFGQFDSEVSRFTELGYAVWPSETYIAMVATKCTVNQLDRSAAFERVYIWPPRPEHAPEVN